METVHRNDTEIEKVYCRLCAELKAKDRMIYIENNNKLDISAKLTRINACADLDIQTFPTSICLLCLNSLEKAYNFVNLVDKAQTHFHNIFVVQNIKQEVETEQEDSQDVTKQDDMSFEIEIDTSTEQRTIETTVKIELMPDNTEDNTEKRLRKKEPKLTWRNYKWTCSYCKAKFSTVEDLKNHSMESHFNCNFFSCPDCICKKYQVDSFVTHLRSHYKSLKLSCHICFQQFKSPREVHQHKTAHMTSKHFCSGCNTCFDTAEDSYVHWKTFFRSSTRKTLNNAEESLMCKVCNKVFERRIHLNNHLLQHAVQKKDHACDKCGKIFLSKANLESHMVSHSDEKPFRCEICGSVFKRHNQLQEHYGVHNFELPFNFNQQNV